MARILNVLFAALVVVLFMSAFATARPLEANEAREKSLLNTTVMADLPGCSTGCNNGCSVTCPFNMFPVCSCSGCQCITCLSCSMNQRCACSGSSCQCVFN
eukprot:Colp12_sorted_trinity150504_noHs@29301